jgi:hypothetical protein
MEFKTKYEVWQFVYLRHDPEQFPRMIVDYCIDKSGIQYLLRCGTEETYHYENELRRTKDKNIAILNKPEDE